MKSSIVPFQQEGKERKNQQNDHKKKLLWEQLEYWNPNHFGNQYMKDHLCILIPSSNFPMPFSEWMPKSNFYFLFWGTCQKGGLDAKILLELLDLCNSRSWLWCTSSILPVYQVQSFFLIAKCVPIHLIPWNCFSTHGV